MTDRQWDAWELLINPEDVSVCFGGAKGGGKSFLFCVWCHYYAKFLIQFFHLTNVLKNPLLVGFMGRKQSVDFQKTTLETFKRVIPADNYIIKEQQKEIVIDNRVKIWFGGLDDTDTVNKFNSAELAFCAIDQAEETEETDLGILEASLRLKHNDKRPPYKILYTANPAECHLKYRFAKPKEKVKGTYFIPALPSDNPHLPDGYVHTLEKAFAYDQKLLRAYRDGDWEVLMPTNQLITYTMVDNLQQIAWMNPVTKKVISCDPSMGGDECVIKVFNNSKEVEQVIMHERDTMKIAGQLVILGEKHQCNQYAIDSIGIGQGIVDRLVEMGKNVLAINSAENADDVEHFSNRRAEMWAYVAREILDKKVEVISDAETIRQMVEVRYKIVNSNGKLQLEPKAETKSRLGRSPDRADAYVYGIWALSRIDANVKGEIYEGDKQGHGERVKVEEEDSEFLTVMR